MICMDANFTQLFLRDLLQLVPGRTKIIFNTYEKEVKQLWHSQKYDPFKQALLQRTKNG